MKTEYDADVDAAYIYIDENIKKGSVTKTIKLDDNITLDFNKNSKLIGIEILHASKVVPKVESLQRIAA